MSVREAQLKRLTKAELVELVMTLEGAEGVTGRWRAYVAGLGPVDRRAAVDVELGLRLAMLIDADELDSPPAPIARALETVQERLEDWRRRRDAAESDSRLGRVTRIGKATK